MGFVAEIIDNVRVSIDRDRNIMLRSVGGSSRELRFIFELSMQDKIVAYIEGFYSSKIATMSPRTIDAHWTFFSFQPKGLDDNQKIEALNLIEEALAPLSQHRSPAPLHSMNIEYKF